MTISLTSAQQAALTGQVRRPRYLTEIIIGAQTLRLATGGNSSWLGNTYVKAGFSVSTIKTIEGGVQTCSISIINENEAYSELVITTGFVFRSIKIWKVYGSPPFDDDDPLPKFVGEIVSIPKMGPIITFNCATKYAATRKLPNITLGPPNIKHLPYPGQRIAIGSDLYIVDID